MKVENPFEPILGLLKWKDSLTDELVSGSFLLYSGHFSRVLFFAGTIYGIVFHLMKPVYCQTSNQVAGRFIDQACIFPQYAAHQLHGPFPEKPESQQNHTFDYYIWIYGLVFLMSYLSALPLAIFKSLQSRTIDELLQVEEILCQCTAARDEQPIETEDVYADDTNVPLNWTDLNENERKELASSYKTVCTLASFFLDKHGGKSFVQAYICSQFIALLSIFLHFLLLISIFGLEIVTETFTLFAYLLALTQESEGNGFPQTKVFSSFAACHFKHFGTSGGMNSVDSFCILRFNLLNAYLFTFIIVALVFFALAIILSTASKCLYIHSSLFRRRVLTWTSHIQPVFALIDDPENINRLYGTEILAEKIYYWPFALLSFTSLNTKRLVQRVEDFTETLKVACEVRLTEQMQLDANKRSQGIKT